MWEAARRIDTDEWANSHVIAEVLGLHTLEATKVLRGLETAGYLRLVSQGGRMDGSVDVASLTEKGNRTVGFWPSDDDAQSFISALEAQRDATEDEDEKGRLTRAITAIAALGGRVASEVLTAWTRVDLMVVWEEDAPRGPSGQGRLGLAQRALTESLGGQVVPAQQLDAAVPLLRSSWS